MAIHANSTPAPERTLLRDTATPGRLLSVAQPSPVQRAELLAILDAGPIDPAALTLLSRSRRRRAQAGIDALIDYLDAVTPDCDLEPSFGFLPFGGIDEAEPDADNEPGLGAPEVEFRASGLPIARGHFDQRHWADGYSSGLPGDADNEVDDADAEPSLGAPERHPSRFYGRDLHADQTWWANGGGQDREEVNEDGGDILDERHDEEADEPSLGSLHCLDQRQWSHGLVTDRELDDSDLEDDGRRVQPAGGAEPSTLSEAQVRAISTLYAMTCDGDCLEPLVQSGAKLVMDPTAPLVHGGLVAFWRRCSDGTMRTYVKRLLFHPPGGLDGPELDACWLFEMLNLRTLRTLLPVVSRELIAVHAIVGTKKPDGRLDPGLVERNVAFLRAGIGRARHAGIVQ